VLAARRVGLDEVERIVIRDDANKLGIVSDKRTMHYFKGCRIALFLDMMDFIASTPAAERCFWLENRR
jgi:hypothetical protein